MSLARWKPQTITLKPWTVSPATSGPWKELGIIPSYNMSRQKHATKETMLTHTIQIFALGNSKNRWCTKKSGVTVAVYQYKIGRE